MATIFFDQVAKKIGADLSDQEVAIVAMVVDLPGAREDLQRSFEAFINMNLNVLRMNMRNQIQAYISTADIGPLSTLLAVVNKP